MKNINWKVRLKSKSFWVALIPALALAVQAIAAVFGFEYDFGDLVNKLIVVVNTVFAVLVIVGIVNDPTTSGISDSQQALTYKQPKKDTVDYGDGQEFTERKDD
ncbi:phage holin [Enterococcus gallinarum]|uniref:Phage holin n=1 Tax=Enterococcus gallinarum TaxID=1353 RepID=A0ABD4HNG7_ENTGA|nr:phage holin [Enterococcus gallinarum]MBA0948692.1 phage holin [Enterococcus gallinarum]MBA0961724.1 phage holin [Enterococcus gallinarum]MBA0969661.1 phage holin [Enterococcus gallinarum]MBA0973023.1 phage holin [Enterococcus gallinarum]NVI95067.1 phage holin [Enterococcus gallinarum]